MNKLIRENLIAAMTALALVVATGFRANDSNSDLVNTINAEKAPKILYIASYNDFYKSEANDYSRAILGRRLALMGEIVTEGNYEEILARASLGLDAFLEFLRANEVTHLLIPKDTYDQGAIVHRWSNHGTIRLPVDNASFQIQSISGGDYPLVLLKIYFKVNASSIREIPSYEIVWSGVREDFHILKRAIKEDYITTYERAYPERIDVSWVLAGENVSFEIRSNEVKQKFQIDIGFIAAYGEKAPPQVLLVKSDGSTQSVTLLANAPKSISLAVQTGEKISISNLFRCTKGTDFDPDGADPRKFCYGVTDVVVRLIDIG